MVHVTKRAATVIEHLLEVQHAPSQNAVRLVPTDEQHFKLVIDSRRLGDRVIRNQRRPLLLLDAEASELLSDRVLDFRASITKPGRRFRLLKQAI